MSFTAYICCMGDTMILGNEGTAKLGGLGFAYKLSRVYKKEVSKDGHKFLEIILPYRSMMFSACAQVPLAVLKAPEDFMQICKELLTKILQENEILTYAVSEDHKG